MGQRAIVAKQLQLKFGALPALRQAQLEAASPAQLEAWAERLLSASSLDQVLGPLPDC